jgi:hypothetical protein
MRAEDAAIHFPKRAVSRQWLDLEYIECRRVDLPALQRGE